MPLILRSTKGSPLTFNELDGNFTYLSESIATGGGTPATASYALTAETAATASYFSGSASLIGSLTATPTGVIITGSLIVSGSNTLNNVGPLTTGDINNIASSNSMAQGESTSATGNYSHAEGLFTSTSGSYSHAEGQSTVTSGSYSHAEGFLSIAFGDYSHAEGYSSAYGTYAHSEGYSLAFGTASHAEGNTSYALSDYSHAEGKETYTGIYAWPTSPITNGVSTVTINLLSSAGNATTPLSVGTAILLERSIDSFDKAITRHIVSSSTFNGTVTQIVVTPQIVGSIQFAPCKISVQSQLLTPDFIFDNQTAVLGGNAAHSEGDSSLAIGNYSNATGIGTIALGEGQFATGRYNTISDTSSLLVVGRGTSNYYRQDAFKVNPIGSITVPTTRSAAPNWTGTDGEMIFATISGNHRFYVWMSGAWRSGSLS
jgi:hypothetical protein